MMFIQFVVSLFATLSFAVLFSAPKVELVFCGITGALGWIVYLACLGANTGKPIANLIAALTLTLVARFFPQHVKTRHHLSALWDIPTGSRCGHLLYLVLFYHESDGFMWTGWHGHRQGCRCHRSWHPVRFCTATKLV